MQIHLTNPFSFSIAQTKRLIASSKGPPAMAPKWEGPLVSEALPKEDSTYFR
jgi:hypothetical protein